MSQENQTAPGETQTVINNEPLMNEGQSLLDELQVKPFETPSNETQSEQEEEKESGIDLEDISSGQNFRIILAIAVVIISAGFIWWIML